MDEKSLYVHILNLTLHGRLNLFLSMKTPVLLPSQLGSLKIPG